MKAKTVFENLEFKRGQAPVKSLDLGINVSKIETKSWKVLDFIKSKEDEGGASLKAIQEFIYFELNGAPLGRDWFYEKDDWNLRQSRGYWNSRLYGGGRFESFKGILPDFCEKRNGKWFVKRYPRKGESFSF